MKLARARTRTGDVAGLIDGENLLPIMNAGADTAQTIREVAMVGIESHHIGPPVPLSNLTLLTPVPRPPSIRDFLLYPEHLVNASGRSLPEGWHDRPGFYFTNPSVVFGPDDTIRSPRTRALDFELELAVLVGRDLTDASPDEAIEAIAGFTIFNDFSARDIQVREAPLGLGPSKGKDFAHAVGPWLVTADELGGTRRRPEAQMLARVNGAEISHGRLETMYFDLGEVLAHASRDSRVVAGDLVATGTIPTGCLAEYRNLHGRDAHAWLQPGDVVELEVGGIGILRNTIGRNPT